MGKQNWVDVENVKSTLLKDPNVSPTTAKHIIEQLQKRASSDPAGNLKDVLGEIKIIRNNVEASFIGLITLSEILEKIKAEEIDVAVSNLQRKFRTVFKKELPLQIDSIIKTLCTDECLKSDFTNTDSLPVRTRQWLERDLVREFEKILNEVFTVL